jgi:hypothetical protein
VSVPNLLEMSKLGRVGSQSARNVRVGSQSARNVCMTARMLEMSKWVGGRVKKFVSLDQRFWPEWPFPVVTLVQ